ncbi:hypothetical protein GCM10025768_14770 [Microbacterium pseudoresistens]|uniref:Anti-sigma-K factor RskA n=1 Tax=Microbacterium pseudoresistens TaxID=640634 RepID=A0A7Y9JLC0_9MICO|nr:anti-sigma factor [Microbacterium pseudoresistens]NYD53170.1 anti-sigma-K factor RskA [Microbacterium pseudoresistens]
MNEEEFAELAAGHALHALSHADEARYLSALREHPEWGAIAASDAETAAGLADGVRPATPEVDVRDRLLAQIASTPQTPPDSAISATEETGEPSAGSTVEPPRRRGLRILFALAAGLALLAGIGYGTVALSNQLNRSPSVVALEKIEAAGDAAQASAALDDGGTATVHWSVELGEGVVVAEGLELLGEGQDYQLWVIRGGAALPAGLLAEPAEGQAIALLDGDVRAGDTVAMTVEQAGGSPTGAPTTDPLFAIPTP